jgi:predicted nucleotidyltransferase
MADDNVGNQINDVALQYAGMLKEHIGLHCLYVYGSYVSGTFTDDSDIDIAVVAEGYSGDFVEDTFKLMKIRRKVDNRIEPYPFYVEDFNDQNPMAKEVMRTVIRIV